MKSPADMRIIQIDVTNACPHHCSNCTRFCGLHEKNFFMSFDFFKKAVDSLKDFPRVVGIMGGEPTLHPQFAEMAKYLMDARPEGWQSHPLVRPVKDFNEFHSKYWNWNDFARRGLWSSLGKNYANHLELISDVFPYQCVNDHKNPGLHQALLLPRKELGIPDEIWYPLRDKCWIQNTWSATITPKGAFFCEVAAALDILFDGPGGWPIEPDWWRRKPEDFGDQLHWCELCSAALAVPHINGNAETEILSPEMYEKLKNRHAWKIETKHYQIFNPKNYKAEDYTLNYDCRPYLHDEDKRFAQLPENVLIPQNIAYCGPLQEATAKFTNTSINQIENMNFRDWCLIAHEKLSPKTIEILSSYIFNPGVLYYSKHFFFFNRRANALHSCAKISLSLAELKKLFPKNKQFFWRKPEGPEYQTFWERLIERLRFSYAFRKTVFLQKRAIAAIHKKG